MQKKIKFSDNIDFNMINDLGADYIINAIPGFSGLHATLFFIRKNCVIGLANKESLVVAGYLINKLLKQHKSAIFPIDSEHFALKKLIQRNSIKNIEKVTITASGGPFYKIEKSNFHKITLEQALKHPKWKMGPYITINSATMMNKAFEIIEAHHLFNLKKEQIETIIHPECIIHGMIHLLNGETIAHLFNPDMKIVIADFLLDNNINIQKNIDLLKTPSLTFVKMDSDKFIPIKLAYKAINSSKLGQVLNTSNEYFVRLFIDGVIKFHEIIYWVETVFMWFYNDNTNQEFRCFSDYYKFNKIITKKCEYLFNNNSING